jgi:hypothetical protein
MLKAFYTSHVVIKLLRQIQASVKTFYILFCADSYLITVSHTLRIVSTNSLFLSESSING